MNPVFFVGTGRCGTHFFERLLQLSDGVKCFHTDDLNPLADSFFRYCRWYGLDFDESSTFTHRKQVIDACRDKNLVYVESNAYLSLGVEDIRRRLDGRIVLVLRDPKKVVASHVNKGWYSAADTSSSMLPGFASSMQGNHYFGRVYPRSDFREKWNNLTQVGKVSWWVNALNLKILHSFDLLDWSGCSVQKIEEFTYERYIELLSVDQLNIMPTSRRRFDALVKKRPGKSQIAVKADDWTNLEKSEFNEMTKPLRNKFGYDAI